MKCAEIMNETVEWLTEEDTVRKAARVMADSGVGFLPICDASGRVIGVVTDRDLTTRALAKNVDPETTSAALVMSSPVVTCLKSTDVREAEDLMAQERKARLVIVDREGKLAGVLSLTDLVERAPRRDSLHTVAAVLWREALGPRGGATPEQWLLKDDPKVRELPPPSDDAEARPTVFTVAHRNTGMKEFP